MIALNSNLDRLQRSGIRQFTNLAKAVEDCVLLTLGEPDYDTPAAITEAAVAALRAGRTHYAPNQGVEELRQKIAQNESARGMECTPEQVLITAGATGALFTALFGILNPGDEVIVPMPAFPLYESIITASGAKMIPLDLSANGWQITREALCALMTPKTKAIILNSPHNPTGTVLNDDSLQAVKNAVLGKPIFVICDNVYDALSTGCPDLSTDKDLRDQILLCQSFSKRCAMTGWRVGYLTGPKEIMERLLLLHAAEVACIPTFIQDACITALETGTSEMTATYARRRAYACSRLTEMGLDYPLPEGAFYIFPDISRFGMTDDEFCRRLITEGRVAAVPGSCFGAPGYIRISFCCSDARLQLGLDRLETFIHSL